MAVHQQREGHLLCYLGLCGQQLQIGLVDLVDYTFILHGGL